jgi:uridylate kinase
MLARDLKVMDTAAVALCRENNVPILVFNLHQEGAFAQVVQGKGRFTLIEEGKAS